MQSASAIERIARVLCRQDGADPDEVRQGEGAAAGRTWLGWQAYAANARACVASLRTLNDSSAMIAGSGALSSVRKGPQPKDAKRCWRAMIEAMLADKAG